jgi:hypothetical protein
MNEMSHPATLTRQMPSMDSDELRQVREAQQTAQRLRDEAIQRLRAHVAAFAAELLLTSQELQSLLPLKRRRKAGDEDSGEVQSEGK